MNLLFVYACPIEVIIICLCEVNRPVQITLNVWKFEEVLKVRLPGLVIT